MAENQKLMDVIRFYANGNQREFSRVTGINPPALSRLVGGQMKLTTKYIEKIRAAYPVAADYLDGVCGLPKVKTEIEIIEELKSTIAELKKDIELKNRMIDSLLKKMGV